ncbi:MAG: hypothetical protein BWY62_01229 [Firmicutes bacterium ADurb.Bin356]|nr:MAG: hypothetical protein BWY62_01229 [Firmicutes bacterium ADurb.Bin356]
MFQICQNACHTPEPGIGILPYQADSMALGCAADHVCRLLPEYRTLAAGWHCRQGRFATHRYLESLQTVFYRLVYRQEAHSFEHRTHPQCNLQHFLDCSKAPGRGQAARGRVFRERYQVLNPLICSQHTHFAPAYKAAQALALTKNHTACQSS